MWVRKLVRKTTRNVCVQIIQNYRDRKGNSRQRVVRTVGSVPPGPMVQNLVRLAEREIVRLQEKKRPSLYPNESRAKRIVQARKAPQGSEALPIADARKLEEVSRICMGFHEAFGILYDQMGFDRIMDSRRKMARRLFKQAVLLRLASPGGSKLGYSRLLSKEEGVEVPVEKFYRMMDAVSEKEIARIKQMVCEETVGMLGGSMNVLFFAVTSLSFASEVEDELRRKGFSKDGKPHRVQVVLALVQTQEGLPVTYELFPGNTTDVKTLEPVLEHLKERFALDRVIVVADAGLLSEKNLVMLRSLGCDYVVAARLRSLNKAQTTIITGKQSWKRLRTGKKITEHVLGGRRLILRYCPEKAKRDVHKREEAIEKVKKELTSGVKGKGRGGRFLNVDPSGVSLHEEAIARDAQYDGLHGVWTSLPDMKAASVYAQYGELWRIEEGFRVWKHTMAIRPIFHWVERRVQVHIAICFVAFALLRILRYRYNTMFGTKERVSEERILTELANVEASIIRDGGTEAEYLIPSKPTPEGIKLYRAVGETLQRQTVLFKPGKLA